MFLEQIERRQKKLQELRRMPVPDPTKPTKTLGVHNCPVELVERLTNIAKEQSKFSGRRVTLSEVAIQLLEKAIKAK